MKPRLLLVALLALSLAPAGAHAQRGARRQRAAAAGVAAAAAPRLDEGRAGQTLPIRRVILYSNGVAYVERRGTVTGHAEVNLSFKQSQVDDVLKSMVVLDLGRGRVGAVSYNSSAPPQARMADIPFSVAAETRGGASGGLAGVLSQLQGARVVVTIAAGRTATGSILTVEERREQPDPSKPATTKHSLVIASEGGELSSFDLADVRGVKLVDEGARRDVGEFAAASASARRRDAKTITVTSDGAGAREMLVSYTIAAPIWKTTYRVVLDAGGQPFFQGWAIVDNVSEEDWEQVSLSLISGTPVSFIQPIQKPFYRYRPVVPMPEDLHLSPQTYEPDTGEGVGGNQVVGSVEDPNGAMVPGASVSLRNEATGQEFAAQTDSEGVFRASGLPAGFYTVTVSVSGFANTVVKGIRVSAARGASIGLTLNPSGVHETVNVVAESPPPARANPVTNLLMDSRDESGEKNEEAEKPPTVGEAMAGGSSGVEAAAQGGEVGDLFEYRIEQPVTVRRDRSALIPIIQTRMEGERVSIFNESHRRDRPMGGLLLKNTSALTFEGGALTVIDGDAYAGEALLERLKPAEQRLVSFALDLGTLVTARSDNDRAPAHLVRIMNGVMYVTAFRREKKTYTVKNQTDRARTVFVEHPLRQGWELDGGLTPAPDGKSRRFYRFRVAVGPNATEQLTVAERVTLTETWAVTNVTPDLLAFFVSSRYVDDSTRAALQNVLDIKARLAAAGARVAQLEREAAEIAADQQRLRENIGALTKTAEARQLIARYVQKADQQETRLEQLARDKQAAEEERQRLQQQLDAAVRALSVERSL